MRRSTGLAFAAAVVGASLVSAAMAQPAVRAIPTDPAACDALNKKLYAWAEAQEKKNTKLIIPREFVRVSYDLDDFCQDKDFDKAQIALDWLNTCIANYTRPYKLGFCQRTSKYFCGLAPDDESCKKK